MSTLDTSMSDPSTPENTLQPDLQPVRIFIGSSPRNLVEEKVFIHTLLKHSKHPIDINIIDGKTASVTNLKTGEVKYLPENLISRIPGATAFSLARWAIPEWCGYQGRAIYCDSDQVALADIAELWNYDLAGGTLAAVPVEAAKSRPYYRRTILKDYLKPAGSFYLASVMLMDCEKAATWSLESVVEWMDQQQKSKQPADLMWLGKHFREHFQVKMQPLPSEWNHLDSWDQNSKIVHFTDLTCQPWKFHHNPVSALWEGLFCEALEQGALSQADVAQSHASGWVSGRIKALASMPRSIFQPINPLWKSSGAIASLSSRFVQKITHKLRSLAIKLHIIPRVTSSAT